MTDAIIRQISDIPASEVDEVDADFKSEGCTTVKTKQDDGNFTITATCPLTPAAAPASPG